jgi:hypothetical protein
MQILSERLFYRWQYRKHFDNRAATPSMKSPRWRQSVGGLRDQFALTEREQDHDARPFFRERRNKTLSSRLARNCASPEKTHLADRAHLLRQAELLLRLAKSASDPEVAASLIQRAADLKEEADESDEATGDTPRDDTAK